MAFPKNAYLAIVGRALPGHPGTGRLTPGFCVEPWRQKRPGPCYEHDPELAHHALPVREESPRWPSLSYSTHARADRRLHRLVGTSPPPGALSPTPPEVRNEVAYSAMRLRRLAQLASAAGHVRRSSQAVTANPRPAGGGCSRGTRKGMKGAGVVGRPQRAHAHGRSPSIRCSQIGTRVPFAILMAHALRADEAGAPPSKTR
jgi:hypothetical protein